MFKIQKKYITIKLNSYILHITNHCIRLNSNFHKKVMQKRIKNFQSKSTQKVKKTIPLKSLFGSSRYLDPLPRYRDSKFT